MPTDENSYNNLIIFSNNNDINRLLNRLPQHQLRLFSYYKLPL